jgi:hypothetical protein
MFESDTNRDIRLCGLEEQSADTGVRCGSLSFLERALEHDFQKVLLTQLFASIGAKPSAMRLPGVLRSNISIRRFFQGRVRTAANVSSS